MNKTDAKLIAKTITYEQLVDMFNNAKERITDWTKVSSVNKGMTIGATWNILHGGLDERMVGRSLGIKNMIWEFGDYLPCELKSKKKTKKSSNIKIHHQEPKF